MRRTRVLVVEDRPAVLKVMAAVLEEAHDVVTAPDCRTAVEVLATTPADVVLTDVRMPDGTGFDVLRAALARQANVQVVLMTAFANVPDAVAAIKLGAFDYVSKPVDADEIALVVARAVQHQRELAHDSSPAPFAAEVVPATTADGPVAFRSAIEAARDRASRVYLAGLLRAHTGNVTRAARAAGLTRESLHRVIRKYGLKPEVYRSDEDDKQSA